MNNIGVVLVNYHTDDQVIKIANIYNSYNVIDKIIVINNEATEDSVNFFLKHNLNKVEVINIKENLGYSKGNNLGLRKLIEDYKMDFVIISNSDIEIEEMTITKLIDLLKSHRSYGALAPRMLNEKMEKTPLRYYELDYKRLFLTCFIKSVDSFFENKITMGTGTIVDQSFLYGSFFVCRSEAMKKCDYFDSNVFLYREEEILGKRLNKAGYKLGVVTDVYYIHNHQYSKENLSIIIKNLKILQKSERYYFKYYLNANKLQMLYVCLFEYIFLINRSLLYLFKKIRGQ